MSQTTINAAILRFEQNENKIDIFVNEEGSYQTNTTPVKTIESLPSFIERMIQRYITLNFKGNWGTGTAYQVNELVKESSIMYICVSDHTSGTFATDLSTGKWAVYQGVTGPDLESLDEGYGVDLVGRALKTVFEVDDLNTTSPSIHSHVYVRCFEALFDDGHGDFDWDDASTETPVRGMIHQVTGLSNGRWKRRTKTGYITPQMVGGDVQVAWNFISGVNGVLDLGNYTYVFTNNDILDLRVNYPSDYHRHEVRGSRAVLDFSGTSLTLNTDIFVRFGANSASQVNENSTFIWGDVRIIGPNNETITADNVPTKKNIGLDIKYAYGLVFDNPLISDCFQGYVITQSFPISCKRPPNSTHCYVGLELKDNCTLGDWRVPQFKNGRFGILIRPTATGTVYGQTFDHANLEGNFVGCVMDTLTGSGVRIHTMDFKEPYMESIDYDGFRIGRVFNIDDATDTGADRANNVFNIKIHGGLWDGNWGTAGHQPILCHAADSANAPAGLDINIPVNWDDCSPGYVRKSVPFANMIELYTGASSAVVKPTVQKTGSWTPAASFDGASVGITYGTCTGRYSKTNNLVVASGRLTLTSNGSSTGVFRITGLPFTAQTTLGSSVTVFYMANTGLAVFPVGRVEAGTTTIDFRIPNGTGGVTNVDDGDINDTAEIHFTAIYHTQFD